MNATKTFNVSELKPKLAAAFRAMRREGLLAKQNYQCCQNCGGYAVTLEAVDLIKSGKVKMKYHIKGCCFYHDQDNDNLKVGQPFMLAYGDMDSTEFGKIGLPTEEVGKIVVKCLEAEGIEIEWDGTGDQRICVVGIK